MHWAIILIVDGGQQQSHQKKWKKSVFEVYKDASLNLEWTERLKEECEKCGIIFFTSPYDPEIIDEIRLELNKFAGKVTYLVTNLI